MLQGFGNTRRPSEGPKKGDRHWFNGQQQYSGSTAPTWRDQFSRSRNDIPAIKNPTQSGEQPGKQVTSWLQNQNVYTPEGVSPQNRTRAANTFQRLQSFLESNKPEE